MSEPQNYNADEPETVCVDLYTDPYYPCVIGPKNKRLGGEIDYVHPRVLADLKAAHVEELAKMAGDQLARDADMYNLAEEVKRLRHDFKNFHRLLCDRFGYVHDDIDWHRDQLSLIEHIAASLERKP